MVDLIYHHNRQRAKRCAQSPADYACAVTAYRSQSHGWKVFLIVGAVLVLAAWRMS